MDCAASDVCCHVSSLWCAIRCMLNVMMWSLTASTKTPFSPAARIPPAGVAVGYAIERGSTISVG